MLYKCIYVCIYIYIGYNIDRYFNFNYFVNYDSGERIVN